MNHTITILNMAIWIIRLQY